MITCVCVCVLYPAVAVVLLVDGYQMGAGLGRVITPMCAAPCGCRGSSRSGPALIRGAGGVG